MLSQWAQFDSPQFASDLQTTLVPRASGGSSTPTFTRASTAYQIDFEGKHNLVLSGEARFQGARRVYNQIASKSELIQGIWAAQGSVTATTDTTYAPPVGRATVTKLVFDSGSGTFMWNSLLDGFVAGHTYRFTADVIAAGATTFKLDCFDGASDFISANGVPVTTLWTRVSAIGTAGASYTGIRQVQLRNNASGTTGTIWVTGIQICDVTGQANQNPGEYVSVGVLAAPYHGANVDGVKYFSALNGNTVASNVVTEATGAAINSSEAACAGGVAMGVVDASGPLGEIDTPSLANVLGTTAAIVRTMTDAGWVSSNITVGSATGADGIASAAASLTATAGNATLLYTTVLGAAVRSYVPLVRRKTGTGVVNITVDNGVTWTPMTLTTTYQPVKETTASAANPVVGFQIVTNTDAIEVDFNMLVAGSVAPDTPIPLNVTTAVEVSQYVSASNISSTATSITMHLTPSVALGSTTVFHWASYVDADNYTAILSDGTNLIARKRIGAVSHDATIAWTRTINTVAKVGARFDTVNGIDVFLNGAQGTHDVTTTASQIGTNFQVGADGNGANQDYCEHRNFVAYSKALSTSRLMALTT